MRVKCQERGPSGACSENAKMKAHGVPGGLQDLVLRDRKEDCEIWFFTYFYLELSKHF